MKEFLEKHPALADACDTVLALSSMAMARRRALCARRAAGHVASEIFDDLRLRFSEQPPQF